MKSIYEKDIETGNATFQTSTPSQEEWDSLHLPENIGSLRIHEKAGFRILGTREKIGKQNGVWRETVLLERRSKRFI